MGYTYEYRTQAEGFPTVVPAMTTYKNVDSVVGEVVSQIEAAVAAGDYDTAAQIISDYEDSVSAEPEKSLKNYMITAETINRLIEDLRNTQIFSMQKQQEIYFSETQPTDAKFGDVWIGGGYEV